MEDSKIKVLLCSPFGKTPGAGGINRWTEHIINYYQSLNSNNVFINLLPISRSVFVNINSPLLFKIKTGLKDYYHIVKKYKKKLSVNKYNVVHLVSSASISLTKDLLMIRIAKRRGLKTIVHFHFGRIPDLAIKKNWEWRLLTKVVRNADKVIVIDKRSYDTLISVGFTNVCNLPNPISPTVVSFVKENADRIIREHNTVLFAGHVVKTKGVFELVEACKTIPDVKLKIAGTLFPGIKEELLQLADKEGDNSWVEIYGTLPYNEVLTEMLKCSVFVLPTYTEGFPNVILESMACGCSIVTTPVGAIPEMLDIEHGDKFGLCVPPQNVEELSFAIQRMLSDKTYAETCGLNARKRVNDLYSMDVVWKQLESIWLSA